MTHPLDVLRDRVSGAIELIFFNHAERVLNDCAGDFDVARRTIIADRDASAWGTYTYAFHNAALRALDVIKREVRRGID